MSNCTLSPEVLKLAEWLHQVVYSGMLPPYLVLGLSFNIILLVTFYKHAHVDQPYNYQVLLTVSKTLEVLVFGTFEVGLNWLCGMFGKGVAWFQRQYILMLLLMRVGAVLHNQFIISSLLLAVAMSADRVFALVLPFRYKNINHGRHQAMAAFVCFTLPSIVSISYTWFFDVVPEGDHYVVIMNTEYVQSPFLKISSCMLVGMRLVAISILVLLNILMIRAFRARTSQIVKMSNHQQMAQAKKEINKTLLVLNVWQSVLMCANQLPHVLLHALITIAPDSTQCLGLAILAPLAEAFIYVTDAMDLVIVMGINKKMRSTVWKAVCCCRKGHVIPSNLSAVGNHATPNR